MAKLALLAQFGAAVFFSLALAQLLFVPALWHSVFLLPLCDTVVSLSDSRPQMAQWFRFRTLVLKWHSGFAFGSLLRAHYARSRTRFGFSLLQLFSMLLHA